MPKYQLGPDRHEVFNHLPGRENGLGIGMTGRKKEEGAISERRPISAGYRREMEAGKASDEPKLVALGALRKGKARRNKDAEPDRWGPLVPTASR